MVSRVIRHELYCKMQDKSFLCSCVPEDLKASKVVIFKQKRTPYTLIFLRRFDYKVLFPICMCVYLSIYLTMLLASSTINKFLGHSMN